MTRSHQASAGSTQWVVPLSDVRVDRELREAVQAVVDWGWWSMGARVEAFERAFAEFCGVRHALGVANGTAALHLALLAAGCGPGDEVVLPSLNFVAAANAIVHTGAKPVFCDVLGEQDLNLDPEDVEAAIGPATKAVLPLHYGGYACDMHAVSRLAERYDLRIVEGPRTRLGRGSTAGLADRSAMSAASASSRTRTSPSARAGCWSRTTMC